jgi:ankyrin repeat protein
MGVPFYSQHLLRLSCRFRWVVCQLEILRQCFARNVQRVLKELPESLDETYERILKGIDQGKRNEVHRLLQCLVVSIRPLRVKELAEILAVDFDNAEGIPMLIPDWRSEDQERGLQAACSSLISIVDTGRSRIVQFSHFSVKEFLTSPRLACSSGDVSRYHVSLEPAHTVLAQACLGVLLRLDDNVVEKGSDEDSSDENSPEEDSSNEDRPDDDSTVVVARQAENLTQRPIMASFPLVKYAAEHWVTHAQFENVSARVRKGMEHLFDPDKPQFSAWLKLYDIDNDTPRSGPIAGIPLYYASLCGFRELAERLTFKHPHHVNASGGYYGTPLIAASAENHFQVAQLLCQHGADVCVRKTYDLTPLHYASMNGYPELVQLLLSHGADANARNQFGRTPLHWAAENGHLDVVRTLLKYDADADVRDNKSRTQLRDASQSGDLDMVRVLPGQGVDVNARDARRMTPLHLASFRGYLEVARSLLEHGADVEAKNMWGKTAFQLVSTYEHGEFMKLLSEHRSKHEGKS